MIYDVYKFGGTSMAQPDTAAAVFEANEENGRLAVVSAIGKDLYSTDTAPKITDVLIGLEEATEEDDSVGANQLRDEIIERTRVTYSMIGDRALSKILDESYQLLKEDSGSGFAWIGEHMSARLFAEFVGAEYVPSGLQFRNGRLVVNASISSIQNSIQSPLSNNTPVVTEGFFGRDMYSGRVATLPRGGSDTSGVIHAAAVQGMGLGTVNHYNYTDQNGILTADPRIVSNPQVIQEITHEEARENMHGISERNGVIHGDSIAYASRLGVRIFVKNTFKPDAPGTKIVERRDDHNQNAIIGVSGKWGVHAINVVDIGMSEAENYLARILSEAANLGMSIANIPTAEDHFKIIFNHGSNSDNLQELEDYIRSNSIDPERVTTDKITDQGSVYVIGQRLKDPRTYTDTIARAAAALSKNGISIKEIVSNEKSPSLALNMAGEDVAPAIKLLHDLFIYAA